MKLTSFRTMSIHPLQLARAALAAFLAVLLVACGGGGGNIPAARDGLRLLSSEFSTRTAASYSPFRSGNRDTETITEAMITEDLKLVAAAGIGLIRLFDSSDMVAKQTLEVIKKNNLNLKVMLGIYVQSDSAIDADKPAIAAYNQAEMARGVALAKQYPDIVLAVSVGNETMVTWSFNKIDPVVMTGFITNVRSQITQPVTTDDNWAFYGDAPSNVINAIDFASVHSYPLLDTTVFDLVLADIEKYVPADKQAEAIAANATLWDWKQEAVPEAQRAAAMMDASIVAAKRQYQIVRNFLDERNLSAMPIVIGETGWKAVNVNNELTFRAHPVNQKMYLDRLTAWADEGKTGAGPKAIIYFEAFDEPWKQGDDGWGLFNVKREARYAIQPLGTCGVTWTCEPGTYTADDAVFYLPPVISGPVTADRYRVYADIAVSGEALPAESPLWVGWGGGSGDTAFTGELTTDSASGDLPTTREIQPAPDVWGWGMIAALVTTSENLTNFETTGTLNFSVKTTYPGKVEVGFLTGTTTTGSAYDVYLPIDPANNPYGYKNDGKWHQVSIPISDITPKGAMAFGMTDPNLSKLDMTQVTNPFVIADRYAVTGKTTGFIGNTEKIYVDAIFWSK